MLLDTNILNFIIAESLLHVVLESRTMSSTPYLLGSWL